MRIPKFITATAAALLLAPLSHADVAQVVDMTVLSGEYTITPARCPPKTCTITKGKFSGTLTATVVADKAFFSNIKIDSGKDGFQLPEDPYTANQSGATADGKFKFDGKTLDFTGFVDSRPFDGPLIDYHLVAQKIDAQVNEPFNPKGFYLARRDYRKCASPMCGGIFVKSVNQASTVCADGKRAKECYVAEENYKKLGFNPFSANPNSTFNTQLLLRGTLAKSSTPNVGKLGVFTALAAYRPANDAAPTGTFYGLEDKGIRCITSPCFSLNEYTLNSREQRAISDLDFSAVKASEEDLANAFLLLGEGDVVPVAGVNKRVRQLAGTGIKLVANQFYLPISAPVAECPEGYSESVKGCVTSGGCAYPQWEQKSIGGAPMKDPLTGEIHGVSTMSCVDKCDPIAEITAQGYCTINLP
jgi:hypothetical protein